MKSFLLDCLILICLMKLICMLTGRFVNLPLFTPIFHERQRIYLLAVQLLCTQEWFCFILWLRNLWVISVRHSCSQGRDLRSCSPRKNIMFSNTVLGALVWMYVSHQEYTFAESTYISGRYIKYEYEYEYLQSMLYIFHRWNLWVLDTAQSFSSSTLPLVEFTALLPNNFLTEVLFFYHHFHPQLGHAHSERIISHY
jgi:hypothetical protein